MPAHKILQVLDFGAKWCGPCRQMDPVMDAIAREYAGRVEVSHVDVDEDRALAQRYDVRSMPTFVFVRDGREVGRVIGARSRAKMTEAIDNALT